MEDNRMSHTRIGDESPAVGLDITGDAPLLVVQDDDGNVLFKIEADQKHAAPCGFSSPFVIENQEGLEIVACGNAGIGSGGHDWPLVVDSLVRDGN